MVADPQPLHEAERAAEPRGRLVHVRVAEPGIITPGGMERFAGRVGGS